MHLYSICHHSFEEEMLSLSIDLSDFLRKGSEINKADFILVIERVPWQFFFYKLVRKYDENAIFLKKRNERDNETIN